MKYLLTLTIAGLLFGCTTPTTNPVVITDDDEETLREFKTVLWPKAYAEQDTALLNQLLHEDFQLIDDNGDKYSKEDELAYIAEYGTTYDEFDFEITRLDIFDNGTAVVSGTGTMKGVNGSEAYITKYQSSNVLIKVEGVWKAINSHVSGVKEETFPMAGAEEE
ncbi:nuclear transport factor 2 family protein [Ekhidna sp.]|uniref:nuclear transport factor 2 family protein n=1 Tax=Ekhidna sp. TaxID=2608089 RepID=UPI003C7B0EF1